MPPFKKYKLGELYNVSSGLSKPREEFGFGHPFVTFKDVFYNYFLPGKLSELANTTEKEIKSCSVKQGDIFLTRTSETMDELGMSSVALKDYSNATFNGFTKRLRLKEEVDMKIDPVFMGYYMRSPEIREQIFMHSSMTTRASLNSAAISSIEIEIPDHEYQKPIGKILKSLDDKIELNRRTNHTLEQIAQTLFKKYFVDDIDPENLPEGWRWGVLSDIIEFSNGYAFSSKELFDEDKGNCFHVFKMGHIKKGGGLNNEGTKSYFDKAKAVGLEKYILKKGDLLMCMTDMKDSMALLGHTALMNEYNKYIVNQRVGLLRIRNDINIGYPFAYILTNSNDFIEDLRSRANSGVQVNLSTAEIKKSKVIIPNKETNREFNQMAEPLFEKIFLLDKENEKLIQLRDSLLPKLMSGEIEVNVAEKELVQA